MSHTPRLTKQIEYLITLLEDVTSRQAETEAKLARVDERTVRLTPAHAAAVKRMAEQTAVALENPIPAMNSQLAHRWIYGRLKKRYQTTSYVEIADELYDQVMAYLQDGLRKLESDEGPGQKSLSIWEWQDF